MAEFNTEPLNYGAIMGQAQALAPDPLAQQGQMAQVGLAKAETMQARQNMALQQRAIQRQQMFGQAIGGFIKNPTAEGLASLYANYPEFEQQASAARGALDRGDITELGEAAAAAAHGQYDVASKSLQTRLDAEKARGADPSLLQHTQQIISLLNSGDPQQQKTALGMLSYGIGVAVGPDKAPAFLKSIGLSQEPEKLSPGDVLKNTTTGETVASAPQPYHFEALLNPDGSQRLVAANPNPGGDVGATVSAPQGGGGPASGVGAAGGLQASVAHVLHNEGGYNPSDMNGSPTNFGINFSANKAVLAKMGITAANFKNMTQDQAAQIYASKYWPQSGAEKLPQNLQAPYFDVYVRSPALAKRALAQSGGDPVKFAQLTNTAFQKMAANNPKAAVYRHAWATRDAGNAAIATGGVQGAPAAVTPDTQAGVAPQGAPAPGQAVTIDAGSPTGALNTKGAEPGHAWNATHTAQIPVPGTDADPNAYTPADIDTAARMWLPTGQFPTGAGGMGGGGTMTLGYKNAVIKRAMQIWQQSGHSSDQLQDMRRQYSSYSSALQGAQQNLSGLQAAEEGLRADANRVLEAHRALADKAPNNPDGLGIVHDSGGLGGLVSTNFANNTRLDWYEKHGSPATQAAIKNYKDAVNGFSATYSKFMSAGNGTGGSAAPSDASSERAGELNDLGMGPTALHKHFESVLAEAANKRMGYQRQVELLNNKIAGLTGTTAGHSANQGARQISSVAEYNALPSGTHYIDPNGVARVKR